MPLGFELCRVPTSPLGPLPNRSPRICRPDQSNARCRADRAFCPGQRHCGACSAQDGAVDFSLAQRVDDRLLLSPDAVGGSPDLLRLEVDILDALSSRMIIDIKDRSYGKREGHLCDPFGHLWLLTTSVEDPARTEIERRLNS